MDIEAWTRAREVLRKRLNESEFRNWIAPLSPAAGAAEDGAVVIAAPTKFMARWVAQHYERPLREALAEAGVAAERLRFQVAAGTGAPGGEAGEEPAARSARARARRGAGAVAAPSWEGEDRGSGSDLPAAKLDPRFTFETFVVGKPNQMAHAAAQRVAEGGPVTFNPLFLYGGVGLGKTHLMHAIAWELRRTQPERRVIYLSAEQFMFRFIQALRQKDTLGFKELFRSVDVLMVDDVQFIAGKESTQEEFFHTFNALVEQNKQIVISGDRAPGEMDGLEERIRSRLHWGLVVDIHPADYELRLGILQSKYERERENYPGVEIEPGVLEFVAHRITSNVRVLEGALIRLFAFGSLIGRPVTLEMARDCLSDLLRSSERRVGLDEIIRKVADHYNLRIADLLGPRRARAVARPRQVAMYLAKQLTTKSLPEIGRGFGGRDHTTVIHAVRRVEELLASDAQLAEDVRLLRRILEG